MARGRHARQAIHRWRGRWAGGLATACFVLALMVVLLPGVPSLASGGDFSLDFAAAAPLTYNHAAGGGAFDDRTIGIDKDVVESLEGGDFACGDVVTFLTAITVDDQADDAQAIQIHFSFLADSTGQSGVALSDVVSVMVNYGAVAGGDGPGDTDLGIEDDLGSTAVLTAESLTGPLFQKGSELLATVAVDDLEAGETVVLRVDTLLSCDPGSRPTGNLQAALTGAEVMVPIAGTISVGQQTIPFKQVGQIASPGVDIEKATNGQDADTPTGPQVEVGSAVTWTYVVTNTGNVTLTGVAVTDDQGVAVSCPSDTLAAGASMTCTASGTAVAGQYANTGRVDTEENVSDTDLSHYFGYPLNEPGVVVEKATNGQDADLPTGPQVVVGSAITWTYVVTNVGNADLSGVTVTDDQGVAVSCPSDTLAVGASMTCTASGTAVAGQYANEARVETNQEVSDTDLSHYFGYVPNEPPSDSVLGAIGDLVWDDANANGFQDFGEQGVSGVAVSLLGGTGSVLVTTNTDSSGRYSFGNLGAGTYRVRFSSPLGFAFSAADQGLDDRYDSDADADGLTDRDTSRGRRSRSDVGRRCIPNRGRAASRDFGTAGIRCCYRGDASDYRGFRRDQSRSGLFPRNSGRPYPADRSSART